MEFERNRERLSAFLFAMTVSCMFLLSSCGGNNISNESASDTGDLSFHVVYHGAAGNRQPQAAVIDCAGEGVSTVEAAVYDSDNALIGSGGPWDCRIGQGTITSVPAGSGRSVVVLGKDGDGAVVFRGEKSDVQVDADSDNDAGIINCYAFVPILQAPIDRAVVNTNAMGLAWNAVTGATQYHVFVSESSTLSNPIIDDTAAIENYSPVNLSNDRTYYWKVVAVDTYGNTGIESQIWSFTVDAQHQNTAPVAQITSPAPDSVFATNNRITFTGRSSDDEDGELSGKSLVWHSDVDGPIGEGAHFDSDPLSEGRHQIKLTAIDSEGATGTASIAITIDPLGLQVISSSPENDEAGVALNSSIVVHFNEPLDPNSVVPGNVQLLLVDQPIAGDLSYDSNEYSITFRPTMVLSPGAVYSFTVSIGIADLLGNALSIPYTISFVTVPGVPSPISPENGSVVPSTGVSFQWSESSGDINSYQLQLSDSDQFVEPTSFFTSSTQVEVPDTPLGLYYWRVRAIDAYGKSGAWSTARDFIGDRTIWLQQRGNKMVSGSAIISLKDGNIVVGGSMIGEMDGYIVEDYHDMFLLYLDHDGEHIWTRVLKTPEEQYVVDIDADASESIYITGYTYYKIGGSPFWPYTSAFLVNYRFDGELASINAYGADGVETRGSDLVIDSNGTVIISGFTGGDLETHINNGSSSLFIAKTKSGLNELAPPVLYQKIDGSASSYSAIDKKGNLYAVASTTGDLPENTNSGESDICLVSWNPQDGKRWARLYGGSGNDLISSIAVDQSDNIYICGTSTSDWDHYTPGNLNTGQGDILVVKLDTDGNLVWVKLIGSPGNDEATGIALDPSGNVFITGYSDGDLSGYINQGKEDIIVAKLSPENGDLLWLEGLGSAEHDIGSAICIDNQNDIIVTGSAQGRLNNLPPTGGVFVWKMTGRDR
jgi:hypothetical protein